MLESERQAKIEIINQEINYLEKRIEQLQNIKNNTLDSLNPENQISIYKKVQSDSALSLSVAEIQRQRFMRNTQSCYLYRRSKRRYDVIRLTAQSYKQAIVCIEFTSLHNGFNLEYEDAYEILAEENKKIKT